MGRKVAFNFQKYVTYDAENNTSTCLLCQRVLRGRLSGNIKRHYATLHNVTKVEKNIYKPSSSSSAGKNQANSTSNFQIPFNNKNEFLLCCVGIVTIKNMPFKIFDDEEYFKKLLRPYEEFYETNINSTNIVCEMNTVANEIKLNISSAVFKKMICLKIEFAKLMKKSILAINVQYINDSKININTIGTIQLKKQHTTQLLKEEIINCLKEFNIDISQIYACTSDSGANVAEISKLLQEVLAQDCEDTASDDEDFDDIHAYLSSVMPVVRCTAHTIQLAANDVLKTIQPELAKCRNFVKNLRTIVANGCPENLEMPLIDDVSSWNSTYKMLKSIESFKEYTKNSSNRNLSELDWNFIQKFLKAFKPLAECITKFQQEQYIFGDFYRDLLCCEIELEEMAQGNIYAKDLLNSMKVRKQNLLANEVFISAIYLDPRFNFIRTPFLSEDQKKTAMNHLLKTHKNIKRLEGKYTEIQDETSPVIISPTCSGSFSKLEARMSLLIEPISLADRTIQQKLESLSNGERVPFDTDILDYWKSAKISDPEFGKLLDAALSVPAAQVSVERAFSALSIILTKMRSKLSAETVNNLILVKLNKNLMENSLITSDSEDE